MRRILAALVLAHAFMAHATEAEFGIRYWHSTGETDWAHCASTACGGTPQTVTIDGTSYTGASGGDPTSRLNYRDTLTHALEIRGRARMENYMAAGQLGVSTGHSGRFRDQDWLSIPGLGSQFLIADTTSPIREGKLDYLVADVGRVFALGSQATLTPLVGVVMYAEDLAAFGLTPGPTDFGPGNCGLYGGTDCTSIPETTEVIRNTVEWTGLRLGAELRAQLAAGTSVLVNAAWVATRVTYDDSHLLRADLGPVPNIRGKGRGTGSMVDLILRWEPRKNLAVDLGWRWWRFDATNATMRFGPDFDTAFPLRSLYSRRGGALLGVSYRFD